MTKPPLLIGLDVGTTSLKGALIDAYGHFLDVASVPYPVNRPAPGWVEQNPLAYAEAADACIRALLKSPEADPNRVAAICAIGQAPTLVLLDRRGSPVRPAILWQDTRAATEATEIAATIGTDALATIIGMRWPVDASLPLARGRWLAKHEPDLLAQIHHVLLPKDYVNWTFTGEMRTDAWSAKGLVHQGTLKTIEGIEELGCFPRTAVPHALTPRDVVGRLTSKAAARTGLRTGTAVICGWTDAMAAMLGSGALGHAGLAGDVSGTSEVAGITLNTEPTSTGPLMTARVADTARWILYGPTQASGASLGWALRTVQLTNEPIAEDERQSIALDLASTVAPGANGLTFLPYLEGERAPIWNPRARGTLTGLSTSTSGPEVIRAVLEGVACSVRHLLDTAIKYGAPPVIEVRVAGGGARVHLWNQIKADVTGLVFRPCATTENGVLGAAILGATGVALYPGVAEASDAMVRLADPIVPNPTNRSVYDDLYRRYVDLYPAVQRAIHDT